MKEAEGRSLPRCPRTPDLAFAAFLPIYSWWLQIKLTSSAYEENAMTNNLGSISLAASNIYHVDRWRQMKGGGIFYNSLANQAASSSLPRDYDFSKVLADHPYPVTVINGFYDYVVGPKGSPYWKRLCASQARNVQLVLIDKAGHNAWIDDPLAFRNALRSALAKT